MGARSFSFSFRDGIELDQKKRSQRVLCQKAPAPLLPVQSIVAGPKSTLMHTAKGNEENEWGWTVRVPRFGYFKFGTRFFFVDETLSSPSSGWGGLLVAILVFR